ncbi:helix-turn-helix domain-containing protein [Aestuariivirga sp.]|uniref:helix-turn-helix domain-containing protein n=1 Tax=Aestuariivirga sp. TaxID=2650926 RepID=UPI0035930592
MKSVKKLVLQHGSLMMALPWIRSEGHAAEVVQALSEAVEAQSELQASRSRSGKKTKIKDEKRDLMTKLLKEGRQVKAVAEAAGVTPMTVYRHLKTPEMREWFRQPGNLMTLADVTDPESMTSELPADFHATDDKMPVVKSSRRKK